MKHLKEYVDWSSQETGFDDSWKLGSYVLVDVKNFTDIVKGENLVYGQITKWRTDDDYPFQILLSNGLNADLESDEIIRYLNKEEIEQYKMELETNKYNL